MKLRRCAAVLLGSAVVMLTGACGSTASSPASAAAVPAANSSTSMSSGPVSGPGSGPGSDPASSQPSRSSGYSQPADSSGTDGRQPCSRPTTMTGFLKLDSAAPAQGGGTQASVTIVTCSVDPVNDEDVEYTPVTSTSVLITMKAPVQVLTPSNTLETVSGSWLVNHQVVNTPYFYYQENADHQITAMQEIYHP